MAEISLRLIDQTRALLAKLPGRLLYGVTRSMPDDFLRAMPSAGITAFGVTSITQARKVRHLAPEASLVLAVNNARAITVAEAYYKLGIREFRISRRDQLNLLLDELEQASDLTVIVHLPRLTNAYRSSDRNLRELGSLLKEARSASDRLGLGYDAGNQFMQAEDHLDKLGELRETIVEAGVTVDLIDICGGKPMGQPLHSPDAFSTFSAIARSFEDLPISYSAELWFQPHTSVFDQEFLLEWRDEVADELPHRRGKAETFFISYASEEESTAREVLKIVERLGHKAIVQFRDFAQTSFVRSMREGLAHTDRFIALQSKRYWTSDHCQAEWDAAYARDPSGKNRFILPFLIEPAPLPPIASELVYKPLFGLSDKQRHAAISEWIEYKPQSRSRSQLRRALAKQASPDVRIHDSQLDAGPNSRFDRPLLDEDLADLPGNLRAITDTLLDALPANTPPIVRGCLTGYRKHLIERGAQPVLGTVVPFAEAIEAQTKADTGHWDVGLEKLFQHFFRRHQLLIAHFPLNPERELLFRETAVDEVRATGSHIISPVTSVGYAIAQLREAGLTTKDFDSAEQAHQEFSRDVASLPMPSEVSDTAITPKRRYVLGTIGFYERMLAALGGVASIGGAALLPPVQAAIATAMTVLRAAIDVLLKLIP